MKFFSFKKTINMVALEARIEQLADILWSQNVFGTNDAVIEGEKEYFIKSVRAYALAETVSPLELTYQAAEILITVATTQKVIGKTIVVDVNVTVEEHASASEIVDYDMLIEELKYT